MTMLGLCGIVFAGTCLMMMLEMPGAQLQHGANVLVVLSFLMLLLRAGLHVQAGMSGLRETSVDRSVELANRYANFGVISSFCMGGALLLFAMSSALDLMGLALVCGVVWMLMAWPLTIRRFFSDRQFGDLLAGDAAPLHRRAPDAGLTSLGWLLVGHAMLGASLQIPQLCSGMFTGVDSDTSREMASLLALTAGVRSIWWSVGITVLEAWAGYELIRMSPQSRIVSTVFGVVGAGISLYINLPVLKLLAHGGGDVTNSIMIGPLALSLIVPVGTILLVNRKIAPTARARFRPRPAGSGPEA
jgi:hypothetical protein